ncbi:acyl carrier protein [Streptomyces sp. NBC_01433]|uniref:acyl carrier protein n=1 Tax=Streptomyces sp. NBC_01433 TaxID=2903864 RepID=UPI00224FED14|nr:acyl carrier protein [Streptomyces sp. NBC_01433]MCX4681809.1 acyl carrier protein [Streptomyces sp. NBC_01433]
MTRDRSAVIAITGTDRAGASAAPAESAAPAAPAAPVDHAQDVREFMFGAWSDLLGCHNLTEHADFFTRGGDSLLFTRLVRRVGKEFGVVIPLHDMSRRNLGDQIDLVHMLRTRGLSGRARPAVTTSDIRTFLAEQWRDVLDCPSPSDGSDFFALGGDSLLVTRLVRRVGKEFGVEVSVRDILTATTLADQTRLVGGLLTEALRPAPLLRRRAA